MKKGRAPDRPVPINGNPPTVKKGVPLLILPEDGGPSTLVIYDLRDDAAWKRAHRDRDAWGKAFCDFEFLDEDHVVLFFRPGGALGASA